MPTATPTTQGFDRAKMEAVPDILGFVLESAQGGFSAQSGSSAKGGFSAQSGSSALTLLLQKLGTHTQEQIAR